MKTKTVINTMRKIVKAYDRLEEKKLKIKRKKEKFLKGGKSMKFGTVIGIVVGAITLIGVGAAAMYFYLQKSCCCDDCCDCCDGDLFDEFPEEGCECEPNTEEVPLEEAAE